MALTAVFTASARDLDDDETPRAGNTERDRASGLRRTETERIFGFVEGSGMEEKGEKEAESDSVARFGKSKGRYLAVGNTTAIEYGVTDDFKFGLGLNTDYHLIMDVPDLIGRNALKFDGLSTEFKFRLLDTATQPVGLAVTFAPGWHRTEAVTGLATSSYSLETRISADAALIPDRLYAAANVVYEPEVSRAGTAEGIGLATAWDRETNFEASAAIVGAVQRGTFLGAELRYLARYQGAFFNTREGSALFLGPSFFTKLTPQVFLKAAWSIQVVGAAADDPDRGLDLRNFERHQARFMVGYQF